MSSEAPVCFPIRPLIRWSILGLYTTLVLPLVVFAGSWAWSGAGLMLLGSVVGGWLLLGLLSQRVWVSPERMWADYPGWVPGWLQQCWSVAWDDVVEAEAATTAQGGLVYYLLTRSGSRILIPLRVAGLGKLLAAIAHFTGIPTAEMRPYVQTWMYGGISLGAGLMALVDVWLLQLVLYT
ncbi:MAG: hypothetical protein Q6K99_02530 [Thermostichales cyanobacterium BF4_bins_65]